MADEIIIPSDVIIEAITIAKAILPSSVIFLVIENLVLTSIITRATINTPNPIPA
jgi:hypothetical protein